MLGINRKFYGKSYKKTLNKKTNGRRKQNSGAIRFISLVYLNRLRCRFTVGA